MARKTVKKELTREEILTQEKQSCYKSAIEETKFIPTPSRYFKVGDKVLYGALKDCIIEEVLADGKAYLILGTATDWMYIRLVDEVGNSNFTENDNIRLYFNNSTIESLLHRAYFFGIDMNTDYQRDFVWDDIDKEYLIDSIFKNVDIGKFVLVHRTDEQWRENGYSYEILDGKQRLNTLKEFYENRFPYHGVYFSELSHNDRHTFLEHMISIAEIKDASKKDILTTFLKLNRGGRVMDKMQIDKVEKMLEDINNG